MIIRYTKPAAKQLDVILHHIAAHSPQGAGNVLDRIDEMLGLIAAQPGVGRATNRVGFGRVNLHPHPYAILYRASASEIVIHAIRHSARKLQR